MKPNLPSHLEVYQELREKPEALLSVVEIKYVTLFDRWVDLNDKFVELKQDLGKVQ